VTYFFRAGDYQPQEYNYADLSQFYIQLAAYYRYAADYQASSGREGVSYQQQHGVLQFQFSKIMRMSPYDKSIINLRLALISAIEAVRERTGQFVSVDDLHAQERARALSLVCNKLIHHIFAANRTEQVITRNDVVTFIRELPILHYGMEDFASDQIALIHKMFTVHYQNMFYVTGRPYEFTNEAIWHASYMGRLFNDPPVVSYLPQRQEAPIAEETISTHKQDNMLMQPKLALDDIDYLDEAPINEFTDDEQPQSPIQSHHIYRSFNTMLVVASPKVSIQSLVERKADAKIKLISTLDAYIADKHEQAAIRRALADSKSRFGAMFGSGQDSDAEEAEAVRILKLISQEEDTGCEEEAIKTHKITFSKGGLRKVIDEFMRANPDEVSAMFETLLSNTPEGLLDALFWSAKTLEQAAHLK